MSNGIETITKYRTSDGKEHFTIESAQYHARQLELSAQASALLDSGGSVADALRVMGYTGTVDPILEKVTKATKLVIPHWQCRDTPGYQVKSMLPYCKFHVWGDAGSWSGSYGGDVPLTDLVRYAKEKRTILI